MQGTWLRSDSPKMKKTKIEKVVVDWFYKRRYFHKIDYPHLEDKVFLMGRRMIDREP